MKKFFAPFLFAIFFAIANTANATVNMADVVAGNLTQSTIDQLDGTHRFTIEWNGKIIQNLTADEVPVILNGDAPINPHGGTAGLTFSYDGPNYSLVIRSGDDIIVHGTYIIEDELDDLFLTFDGLDLDWEYPEGADDPDNHEFIEEEARTAYDNAMADYIASKSSVIAGLDEFIANNGNVRIIATNIRTGEKTIGYIGEGMEEMEFTVVNLPVAQAIPDGFVQISPVDAPTLVVSQETYASMPTMYKTNLTKLLYAMAYDGDITAETLATYVNGNPVTIMGAKTYEVNVTEARPDYLYTESHPRISEDGVILVFLHYLMKGIEGIMDFMTYSPRVLVG